MILSALQALAIRLVGSAIATYNLVHVLDYRNLWNNERWKSFNSHFSII